MVEGTYQVRGERVIVTLTFATLDAAREALEQVGERPEGEEWSDTLFQALRAAVSAE